MICSDKITMWFMYGILVIVFMISFICQYRASSLSNNQSSPTEGERGQESMNVLFTLYGVVTLIYSLAVQASDYGYGHKAFLILLDYVVFTYLFFFNGRFRNIIFRLYGRIRKE